MVTRGRANQRSHKRGVPVKNRASGVEAVMAIHWTAGGRLAAPIRRPVDL